MQQLTNAFYIQSPRLQNSPILAILREALFLPPPLIQILVLLMDRNQGEGQSSLRPHIVS